MKPYIRIQRRFIKFAFVSFFLSTLLSSTASTTAAASGFDLSFSNTDCTAFPDQASCDLALGQVANAFGQIFSQDLLSDFIGAGADANALSSRSSVSPGLRRSEHRHWITLSANGAVQSPKNGGDRSQTEAGLNRLPGVGVGAKAFVTVGLPSETLGIPGIFGLDPNRTTWTASIGGYNAKIAKLQYQFIHFGIGASYDWKPSVRNDFLAGWSGFRVNTGLFYSKTRINYSTPLNFSGSGGGVTTSWRSDLDLALNSNVVSIPTEIITGIDLLKVLSFYTGLGLDLNVGSAKTEGVLSGSLNNDSNGLLVSNVNVSANSDTESVTFIQPRALVGIQIGIDPVSIHTQVFFAKSAVGAQVGLTGSW